MKVKKNMRNVPKRLLLALLTVLMVVSVIVPVSAAELEWNLLTDAEAGYRVERMHETWQDGTEEDGTPYLYNTNNKSGALYIYDDNNILGNYKTFSLEGDFYFDSFPTGVRDGQYSPEQRPLSFLCWQYKDIEKEKSYVFNALRLDSEGYIYVNANETGKTDVRLETGKWMNIKCVFTPESGRSEMLIDGKKVLDFSIAKFDQTKVVSYAVRYFDGYYNWSAKMKNLIVKTNSEYVIQLKREASADYVGYQTAKPTGDKFSARMIFGIDDIAYKNVGYEAILVTKNNDGEVISTGISNTTVTIYPELKDANGKVYDAKTTFDYTYAAAVTIDDLPLSPTDGVFELVVRPYVLCRNNMRRYGIAAHLFYNGEKDADGYPVFSEKSGNDYTVQATDDTYIYNANGHLEKDNSTVKNMQVRNTGNEKSGLYRAAYYKFTLDQTAVKALETASAVELRVYNGGTENNPARKKYDMMLYSTDTKWTEKQLNYANHNNIAKSGELLKKFAYEDNVYMVIDILDFLCEQPLNDDGTLTVSFCFANEGANDALLTYLYSKESNMKPTIEIRNSLYRHSTLNLSKSDNEGYEPWGYAESIVNEWFDDLEAKIYPKDANGNLKEFEIDDLAPNGYNATEATGDFTYELTWREGTDWKPTDTTVPTNPWRNDKYARTLSTLGTVSTGNAFLKSLYAKETSQYDVYGGITNAGFTGQKTGFFHTEQHDGRYYIIDPLGNPFFAVGINTFCLGDSENHKRYSLAKYGTEENYFNEITASMKSFGVTTSYGGDIDKVLAVENGLSGIVHLSVVSNYMSSLGLCTPDEAIKFYNNNTMNVFDPDFIKATNKTLAARIEAGGYADMPNVFGYTTDNELPSGNDFLLRYLTLNPEEPTASFSYATAWTWLARRMDMVNPTLDDYMNSPEREQMNSEFLGLVYGRYYRIAREAIRAVDPNHMYFGSRVNGNCRTDAYYLHAAGYYLDIISANLYGGLNPDAKTITDFYRQSGKPFIVTEFFAKGKDAIDANGYGLTNPTGAGILVRTQEDRAAYYEHYTLALLESKACVGWTWYRYRDNDQGLYRTPGTQNVLRMLSVDYTKQKANSFMDENGNVIMAADAGDVTEIYKGEPIASNQAVNKGFFNSNFNSTVTVYTYNARGELVDSKAYDVQKPDSERPANGTVVKALKGDQTFTIGVVNQNGVITETVLTVYEGKYLALTDSVKAISDHLMGIVRFFDAK